MAHALADTVVVLHAAFVLFVALGGLLAFRWPRVVRLHLPAVVWGVLVELAGWPCPLTPLENHLRALGADRPYAGGFVERYLLPVLYPAELTRTVQIGLGAAALAVNLVVYGGVLRARAARRRRRNRA